MTQAAEVEVISAETENTPLVIDADVTNEKLSELAITYSKDNYPKDLSIQEDYDFIQKGINDMRGFCARIKEKAAEKRSVYTKASKKVSTEEKRIDGLLRDLINPMAEHKKLHDDKVAAEKERKRIADQLRKDTHLANINSIRILISKAQGVCSTTIEAVIAELNNIEVNAAYEEFEKEAHDVWEDTDLALTRMLITAQNQEEADRKRKEEDARLKQEREDLEAQRLENERIQKENQRIAEENRKATEKLEEKTAEPEKVSQVDPEPNDMQATSEFTPDSAKSSGHASPSVAKKIDEDNSVVAQCKAKAIKAIEEVISNSNYDDPKDAAENVFAEIQANNISNITYSIY